MGVIHVKSAAEWKELKGSGGAFGTPAAVIVDFSATWCGPCQMIGPVFEKLSTSYPSIKFCKIDVDELQDVAGECGVRAMPTFQAYFNGEKVDELTGANPSALEAMIKKLVDKASKGSAGAGQKLGGEGSASAAPASADDMRARLAAAAEARFKAQAQ